MTNTYSAVTMLILDLEKVLFDLGTSSISDISMRVKDAWVKMSTLIVKAGKDSMPEDLLARHYDIDQKSAKDDFNASIVIQDIITLFIKAIELGNALPKE